VAARLRASCSRRRAVPLQQALASLGAAVPTARACPSAAVSARQLSARGRLAGAGGVAGSAAVPPVNIAGASPPLPPPHACPRALSRRSRSVFVSGGGSNFKAIHAATEDGRINGRVVVRAPRARILPLLSCMHLTPVCPRSSW
jgi:hypothetical protein